MDVCGRAIVGIYLRGLPAAWQWRTFTRFLRADVEVVFVKIQASLHFAQVKPTWMLRVLEELEPSAEGVYVFDPDMFVVGPWTFFERWLNIWHRGV